MSAPLRQVPEARSVSSGIGSGRNAVVRAGLVEELFGGDVHGGDAREREVRTGQLSRCCAALAGRLARRRRSAPSDRRPCRIAPCSLPPRRRARLLLCREPQAPREGTADPARSDRSRLDRRTPGVRSRPRRCRRRPRRRLRRSRAAATNPFLHLSMHLSISEQIASTSRAASSRRSTCCARRLGSAHDAQHEVMECLGEMMWESQRSGRPPDGEAYIDCVRRRATR